MLMESEKKKGSPKDCSTAQQLLNYFNKKIASVRRSTGGYRAQSSLVPPTTTLDEFTECSEEDIKTIIMSHQSKSGEFDSLPSNILKKLLTEILPFMIGMCNASLRQGMLSPRQRRVITMPRIKKPNADQTDVKNYRPISNLTFASKLTERLICQQLMAFLERENLILVHHLAYRKYHLSETVILKIVSDALFAADCREITLLGLLDLSAAFDRVDYDI